MFEVLGFYKFTKIKSLKKNKVLLQDLLIKKEIRAFKINNLVKINFNPESWDKNLSYKPIRLVFNKRAFTGLEKFDDTYQYPMPK